MSHPNEPDDLLDLAHAVGVVPDPIQSEDADLSVIDLAAERAKRNG